MTTLTVRLTEELDHFIASKVDAGVYADASEVVVTALRLLEKDEQENEAKLSALRSAIDKGIASGIAEPGVFTRIRSKYGLPEVEA